MIENERFQLSKAEMEFVKNQTMTIQIVIFSFNTVGFIVSVASLLILILTAVLFAEWRNKYKNQVILQIMVARFLYSLVRVAFDASIVFGFSSKKSFILHYDTMLYIYTELVLVGWMHVFTKTMYNYLVIVILAPSKLSLPIISLITWITPLVVSILIIVILHFEVSFKLYMYISYYMIIKWPLLFYNGVLLLKIFKSLRNKNDNLNNNITNRRDNNNIKIVSIMLLLMFVFSVHQIIMDISKIVYVAIYIKNDNITIFIIAIDVIFISISLYYCAISICYWLFYNKDTRDLWSNFLKTKLLRTKPDLPPTTYKV